MKTKYKIAIIITGLMAGWFGANAYAKQIAERKFGPLLGVLTDYKMSASAISAEVNISNLTSREFTVDRIHTSGDGLDNLLIEVEGLRMSLEVSQEVKEETGVDFSGYSLNLRSSTQCVEGVCKVLTSISGKNLTNISFDYIFDEQTLLRVIDLINTAESGNISEEEIGLKLLDILASSKTIDLSIKFEDLGVLSLLKTLDVDIPSIILSKFEYSIKLNNDNNSFETSLLIDGDLLAKIDLLLGVDISNVDFSNTETAIQATKGISIKSFDLVLEDKGGLEKIPEFNEIKEKINLDFNEKNKDSEFRLIVQNSPVTKILLEATNSKSVEQLSKEISDFLNNPSKLEISFKPNKPFPVVALLPVIMGLSDGSLLLNYADDLNILFNSNKLINSSTSQSKLDELDKEERMLLEKISQLKLKKNRLKMINKKKPSNKVVSSLCKKISGTWYYDFSDNNNINFGKFVYEESGHFDNYGMSAYDGNKTLEEYSEVGSWKCDGIQYMETFEKESYKYSIIKSKSDVFTVVDDNGVIYTHTRIPPKVDFSAIKDKNILIKAQALMSNDVEQIVDSANKTWSKDELMAQGEGVYNANCAGCHKKDGSGMPPIFPAMKESPIANGAAADHIGIVLHGKGGMPTFKMLGDADLAAVITYERNAFGNTGSVVQPSDVTSAR
jgi:mono/diheme cytochrome c family protein